MPVHPSIRRSFALSCRPVVLSLCISVAAAGGLRAEDLTNAAVPSTMDGGNSTYTLDGYALDWGTVGTVLVGNTTVGNSLTIRNGATATSYSSTTTGISVGKTATSTGNSVTVTGAGSNWTVVGSTSVRGYLYFGELGGGNNITISNGGTVNANSSSLGYGRSDSNTYGSNNTGLVTGAGSAWISTGGMNVGVSGSNNSLTVSGGGTVTSNSSTVGSGQSVINATFGNYNSVLVTGVGSYWENLGSSGSTTIGSSGTYNTFTVAAGGTVASKQVTVGTGHSLYQALGQYNTATIDGAQSAWTVEGNITVGSYGSNNVLNVRNGGKLQSGTNGTGIARIGSSAPGATAWGAGNSVVVQGSGSLWTNGGSLTVGSYGSGNSLKVLDGGHVTNTGALIGENSDGLNNNVLVSGTGSLWEATGSVAIGTAGNSGNTLTLENRGLAIVGDASDDTFSIASGNYLRLSGGYLALFGDQQSLLQSLISSGSVQVGQGANWTGATSGDLSMAYFAPGANTSAFTGGQYANLGGYTLVTAAAVPEPGSAGLLILGLGLSGFRRWRKRQA